MLLDWIIKNWVEVTASITGLIAIYYQIKENVIFWPISIINVLLYLFVFFTSRLYAEVSLQIYYLVVSFYGWYCWASGTKTNNKSELKITKCSKKLIYTLLIIFVVVFIFMSYVLKNFTNTDVPYIDAFVTTLSFIATWLLAKKKIENWLVWIFVDFISIGVYIYKELYATIVLFAVLTVLAIYGYIQWKKKLIK